MAGHRPEFSFQSAACEIFSGGSAASGLVFLGRGRADDAFQRPSDRLWAAAHVLGRQRHAAMQRAFTGTRCTSGLTFALIGLALAYVRFRHESHGLISETFRPIFETQRGWRRGKD